MSSTPNPSHRRSSAGAWPVKTREELEAEYGEVWDVRQLAKAFVVTSIIGNEIVVRRRDDGVVGSLTYQNHPRYFFEFVPAAVDG